MLAVLVVGYPVLWVLARPSGQPSGRYVGEVLGAEAVLLFSCALVLATLLAVIEWAFDGRTGSPRPVSGIEEVMPGASAR